MQVLHECSHDKFRETITSHTLALRNLCQEWKKEVNNPKISEDIIGEINVATGQSELLIKERFSQFSSLIDDSEFERSEKDVTLEDLQGFWDIIIFQVENIKSNFGKLSKLKQNSWLPPQPSLPDNIKPKARPFALHNKVVKSKHVGVANSSIRDHILAQRKKLKLEAKKEERAKETAPIADPEGESNENKSPERGHCSPLPLRSEESTDIKKFDAGFFQIRTPVQKSSRPCKRIHDSNSNPALTSPKVLASSALKKRVRETPVSHKDYSPCMRITRSMKKSSQRYRQFEGPTP